MSIEFVKRVLGHSAFPVVLVALALVLCAPTLRTGWATDDLIHNAMLNPQHPIKGKGFYLDSNRFRPAIMTLFRWFAGDLTRKFTDYGVLPWWTHPESQCSFWRPLSAVTHWLDAKLWPASPAAMHLHSALWYGGLVFLVALAYRGLMKPAWTAGFAALAFAINQEGYQATAWIAARNSILAILFVALTVRLYHCHAQRRSFGWGLAALSSLAVGFLAGEAAVAAVVYLVSYALTMDERSWPARIASLAPSFTLLVAWRVAYRATGFGVSHSGFYLDPGSDPLRYAFNLVEWGPLVLLDVVTGPILVPYASLAPAMKPWFWAAGVLALARVAVAFLPLIRAERAARFWAIGLALALIPACATTAPSDRVTLGVMFGFAPLAAMFVTGVATDAAWVPRGSVVRRFLQAIAVLLFACHVVLPLSGHAKRLFHLVAGSRPAAPFTEAVFHAPAQELVIVTSPYVMHLAYIPFQQAQDGIELPSHIRTLSSSLRDVTLRRIDTNVLEIASTGSPLIPARPRRSDCPPGFPSSHPLYHGWLISTFRADGLCFAPGDRTALTGMTVVVDRVNDRGLPMETTFTFDRSLDDVRYHWVFWNTAQDLYAPFTPPRVGEQIRLPGPFVYSPQGSRSRVQGW